MQGKSTIVFLVSSAVSTAPYRLLPRCYCTAALFHRWRDEMCDVSVELRYSCTGTPHTGAHRTRRQYYATILDTPPQ